MNVIELKEQIQRWKIKASILLKENKRIFIKDVKDKYYWADLLNYNEDKILFRPFKGNNFDEILEFYWVDLVEFDEYKEVKNVK